MRTIAMLSAAVLVLMATTPAYAFLTGQGWGNGAYTDQREGRGFGKRDSGALQDQGGKVFGPGYFPGRNTGGWYSTPNGQNRSKSTNPGTANPGWGGGNGND